ncbi:MAG: cytochrome c [Solirubrobacterales bacterium]
MPTRSANRFAGVAAATIVLGVALALAGCGSDGSSDNGGSTQGGPVNGKRVFADSGCAGCHTLAAGNSSGTSGPNLDKLKPTRAEVAAQVEDGGGGMPAFGNKLSEAEITAVAVFVANSAGR